MSHNGNDNSSDSNLAEFKGRPSPGPEAPHAGVRARGVAELRRILRSVIQITHLCNILQ